MKSRYSIVTLAVGATLALAPLAQARLVSDDSATSHTHATSHKQFQSQNLRPDNRAGRLGA
jgi:hypothetical protein